MADIHGLKPNVRPAAPYNVTAQIRWDIRQIVQQEIAQIAIETIGAETPAGAQAKVDTSALSLTAAIAAAKAELQLADDAKAALVHTHDDRYYLKAQVDAALAGKAATVHTHHDQYYIKSEIDTLLVGAGAVHDHNGLYYLKSEIASLLLAKAPVMHYHDDRYCTEAEMAGLLAGKAATSHTHDDRYYTEAEVDALIAGVSGGAGWVPVAATTTEQGVVELATTVETTTGMDGTRAVTPAGVKAALDAKAASDMSTYVAQTRTVNGKALSANITLSAADVSAAPALGADDNYVTNAEKLALHSHANKTALDAVSGTNTGDQDLSGLVAKATIDAKGDLLVGTADNTVGRLAVGATNGHVLTLDSAEAAGMKWAAAAGGGVPLTHFYAPWSWASTATTGGHTKFTLIAGRLVPCPQFVNVSKTTTKVNLVVDIGVAGTSIEVALYTINADGTSTHLSTLGTIDSTTSGTKTITGLSVSMPAGLYAVVLRPIGGNVVVLGRTGGFLLVATSDATGGTNAFRFPYAGGTSMPANITWDYNFGVYGNTFPVATMGW